VFPWFVLSNGTGTAIDLDKMLYWYEKSVDQENMYGLTISDTAITKESA
jgi:hypothetical protein